MTFFRRGLSGDYLKDVVRQNCTTLIQAKHACEQTDLYLSQIKAIASGKGQYVGASSQGEPMELDTATIKKTHRKIKKEEQAKRIKIDYSKIPTEVLGKLMKEKRCLNCGEEGHRYTFCKNTAQDFDQE